MAENTSRLARAPSVSSAGTASTSGNYGVVPRYTPRPEPAYISASSAADHITHRHHHENYGLLSPTATPTNDGAEFSPSALALLNSFLDSLLYNILSKARSTELSKLRLAILEVLKAKLGREALASADEELDGLLGDIDDEDSADDYPNGSHNYARRSSTPSLDWHLESAFKRMRLRVMVFIRLGDFDDDDEEKFLDDDALATSPALDHSIVSSPSAVFLASVLEYLAEQSLSLVGDAAYARSKSRTRKTLRENLAVRMYDSDNVIVEDIDVEKIALNSSLGRLWRTWRKNQRSIAVPASPAREFSSRRSSVVSPTPMRMAEEKLRRSELRKSGTFHIMQTVDAAQEDAQDEEDIPDCEPSETAIASNIPLPFTDRDVDEIEIPGLAAVIYDEDEERSDDGHVVEAKLGRPRSASFSVPGAFIVDPTAEEDASSVVKPVLKRQRSNSVPHVGSTPWGWIPASVRRALARLAEMDDVELASITPLPEDDDDDFADVSGDDTAEALVTKGSTLEGENVEDHAVVLDEVNVPQTLVTGAADGTERSQLNSQEPLDNVAADIPGDVHSEQVPLASALEPTLGKDIASETSELASDVKNTNTGAIAGASAIIAATGAALAAAAASVGPKSSAGHDSHVAQGADDLSVQTKEVFQPGDDEPAPPSAQEVNINGVDSKMSSPMHIVNLAQTPTITNKQPNSVEQTSIGLSERKDQVEVAPSAVIPKKEVTTQTPVPTVISAKEGPPKPLTSNGNNQHVNPYAMLYDDIEPEAIGVAKTSNIPIHSTTPSVSTPESRPWTPNRGAVRSPSFKGNANVEQRARNIPSPLRVGNEQQSLNQASQSVNEKLQAAQTTDEYDLDKPIDPGRFQSWAKPKDSPTIPKFYNATSNPTTAEAPTKNSVTYSGADHSPKGSQSSYKSNKRASEELKEREFDALLDRKETVKYTLTPEEIRDVGPYSPTTPNGDRKIPAPIDTARKASSPGALSPTLLRKTSATTQVQIQQPPAPMATVVPVVPTLTTTQSKPQVQVHAAKQPPASLRPLKISEIRKSISALSPEPSEPRMRRSGLMAREARVLGGDTKDFVDFIRSCAPTSEQQVQPAALTNRWSAGPTMGTMRSTKSNMVPREPDLRNGASGDLIQFLREGPQNGSIGPVSPTKAPLADINKPLPMPNTTTSSATGPQVTRKIHRNKDPYALESDDEDDEFTALPTSNTRANGVSQPENLQDFLRATSHGQSRSNGNIISLPSQNGSTVQRSVSAAGHRSTQVASSLPSSTNAGLSTHNALGNNALPSNESSKASGGFFSRKKYEARPAGATRGFGGHGFHYSTSDLADYLRSSGPSGAASNGNASNGAPASNGNAAKDGYTSGTASGRNTPSGSIGMKRGDSTRRRMFGRKQVEV